MHNIKSFFDLNINNQGKVNNYITTLIAADSTGDLSASNAGVSIVLRDLRPLALARILNPLSAVPTARRFPSLLNLKCGRPWIDSYNHIRDVLVKCKLSSRRLKTVKPTCSPPSASVLVRGLTLSMSQNMICPSSPAAKKRFWVVSNCMTPLDFFLNPLYVLLMAPSLSFHSTRNDSPSLLVPQENNLEK